MRAQFGGTPSPQVSMKPSEPPLNKPVAFVNPPFGRPIRLGQIAGWAVFPEKRQIPCLVQRVTGGQYRGMNEKPDCRLYYAGLSIEESRKFCHIVHLSRGLSLRRTSQRPRAFLIKFASLTSGTMLQFLSHSVHEVVRDFFYPR